jgi:hypothetical protein
MFALLRSHFPKASSRDLVTRALYITYSLDGSKHQRNPEVGFGVVLPYDALTRAVPAGAANPVYDAITTTPSTPPVPATSASAPTSAPPGTGSSSAPPGADAGSNSSNTGFIIGIVVAVVVAAGLLVLLLLRSRRPARR